MVEWIVKFLYETSWLLGFSKISWLVCDMEIGYSNSPPPPFFDVLYVIQNTKHRKIRGVDS